MLPTHKKKVQAAIRRLKGLCNRLEIMIEEDADCPRILELVLAMQGHMKHVQGIILESHIHTCGGKNLSTKNKRRKEAFVKELVSVIGLSTR